MSANRAAMLAKLADLDTEHALAVAGGGEKYVERHLAGDDVIADAALAKQTAVEASTYVCDRAVQLHGGTGYLHGTEVERHYRDARILPIGGGATEVLTDLAAKLLGYDA